MLLDCSLDVLGNCAQKLLYQYAGNCHRYQVSGDLPANQKTRNIQQINRTQCIDIHLRPRMVCLPVHYNSPL